MCMFLHSRKPLMILAHGIPKMLFVEASPPISESASCCWVHFAETFEYCSWQQRPVWGQTRKNHGAELRVLIARLQRWKSPIKHLISLSNKLNILITHRSLCFNAWDFYLLFTFLLNDLRNSTVCFPVTFTQLKSTTHSLLMHSLCW